MRRELVEKRRWLAEDEFLRMFAACNLVPGPSSTELAIFTGYRLAGWPGLLLAGGLFIAPAMLIMLALAALYARAGSTAPAVAVLSGVRPVVVGIMAWALLDLGRRVTPRAALVALAVGCALLSVAGVNPLAVLAVGGFAVLAGRRLRAMAAIPAIPALAFHAERLPVLFLTFLKLGAVSFGSGYVLFAFLESDFVEGLRWLPRQQLVDAVALGQVTPGPVFTTATFLGYLFAGVPGALLATLGIFLPGFAFVPFLDRLVRAVEARPAVRAFLDGVNVAVVGLIAAVALQLGAASIQGVAGAVLALAAFGLIVWRPLAAPAAVVAGAVAGLGLGLGAHVRL